MSAGQLGIPFRFTEVDGVPCFWADAPGAPSAGLLFRVGRADEQLAYGGVTELVKQLALHDLPHARYDSSGHVAATTTAFYATGRPSELVDFLAHVCRTLGDLPLDRLDSEKRVSGIEAERRRPTVLDRMLTMRFGAQGQGLAFYEPMGLRWLGAEHVADWSARWFTRGNAALWLSCPPPAGLRLRLPDGQRVAPPEPQPLAALALPAYAASGSGVVASSVVAPRSAASAAAGRTVADRVHAALDLDVAAWQFPLTAGLAHRSLSVDCPDDRAVEVLHAVTAAYDTVAAEGPTAGELAGAAHATAAAIAHDDAVAGGLDRMAVDELLGDRRRWKEDLVREAEAVSYAEAAAALREALGTQLLLAPATAPKPHERLHEFPWFSADRVQGTELGPLRRDRAAVRLVAGPDGVSHVAQDTGRASTVRFADVAAAVQEPDGSLTLIGRDGAIVAIDPHAFKGAGQVVADVERRLPPELVVPPRDSGTIETLARRKLRRGAPVARELRLLHDLIGQDESLVTMAEAVVGFHLGVLVLTDRRVVWVHQGDTAPVVRELPYRDVLGVKLGRIPSQVVTLRSPVGETAFSRVMPRERAPEVVEEIERRAAAARAEPTAAEPPQ